MKNKHINTFDTEEEYLNYLPTASFPNIAYVKEYDRIYYKEDNIIHFKDTTVKNILLNAAYGDTSREITYETANDPLWDTVLNTQNLFSSISTYFKFPELRYFRNVHRYNIYMPVKYCTEIDNTNIYFVGGQSTFTLTVPHMVNLPKCISNQQQIGRGETSPYIANFGKAITDINIYGLRGLGRVIVCQAIIPPMINSGSSYDTFNVNDKAVLYVPASAVSTYRGTTGWNLVEKIYAIGGAEWKVDSIVQDYLPYLTIDQSLLSNESE